MTPRILQATPHPQDPLSCSVPLPYRREFYPNGFTACLATNSEAVLKAAEESWAGVCRKFDDAPVEVWCLVSNHRAAEIPPRPVVRARRNLFVSVADADNALSCDLAGGFASIWVTEAVVSAADYFRYHFLEAAVYCLMDMRNVVSVHAACVALNGRGVLLAGDSGAGKTSLAYACARRGWVYTADDASRLVRRGSGRTVLGNARSFRFRASAGRLFPEFAGMKESRRADGKPTIEVRTASLPAIHTAGEARIEHIVFLNRSDEMGRRAVLTPVGEDEAYRRIWWDPWPAEVSGADERRAAVRRLCTASSWEMSYRDLDAAIDRLERLVFGGSE